MLKKFYAICWDMTIVDLGNHDDFSSADEYAEKLKLETLYLSDEVGLAKLKESIQKLNLP
jgi:hypothetical protein